jgi:ferredoxin-NADP reductase
LLLAGGSGITPVFSILRTVLKQHQGNVVLFYANRDERSVRSSRRTCSSWRPSIRIAW